MHANCIGVFFVFVFIAMFERTMQIHVQSKVVAAMVWSLASLSWLILHRDPNKRFVSLATWTCCVVHVELLHASPLTFPSCFPHPPCASIVRRKLVLFVNTCDLLFSAFISPHFESILHTFPTHECSFRLCLLWRYSNLSIKCSWPKSSSFVISG